MKIKFGKSLVQSLSILFSNIFLFHFIPYIFYIFYFNVYCMHIYIYIYIYIHIYIYVDNKYVIKKIKYNNNHFPIMISIDYVHILLKMAGIHRVNSIKIIFRSNII